MSRAFEKMSEILAAERTDEEILELLSVVGMDALGDDLLLDASMLHRGYVLRVMMALKHEQRDRIIVRLQARRSSIIQSVKIAACAGAKKS